MKPFTLLLLFSISLFIQLINADGDMTFQSLVEKLEENAKATKQKLKHDLCFLQHISPSTYKLWLSFTQAPPKFLAFDIMENMLKKVPLDMITDGQSTRDFLRNHITGAIEQQTAEIGDLYQQICAAHRYSLSDAKKPQFAHYYWAWYQKVADKKDMKRIIKGMNLMISDHYQLLQQLNGKMERLEIFRSLAKTCSALVKYYSRKMISLKELDLIVEYSQDIVYAVRKTLSVQPKLIQKLQDVKKILMNYNKRRTRWAEFIIDMRQSPIAHQGEPSMEEVNFENCCCVV
ncbi:uncharacterized protein LOC116336631 [Contarinia nasturtii]|uniref:uncharacterized protein LOC116336631 n=1 Tax=Contarinia nasturtii TaxID=265458 RepID=UPI0012D4A19F|nr:uncharacterized protein LOC116336631 [Contarinia nasturtii]